MQLGVRCVLWIAVICVLKAYTSADENALEFSSQPEDTTAIEGRNATLYCATTKVDNVSLYWTLDGQKLENDTRRFMRNSNLYISRVSLLNDIGEFKCVATNVSSEHSITSTSAQLNILWITDTVRVLATESSWDPELGGELTLRCKADGNPETRISWFFNGDQLLMNERMTNKSNQLRISDLRLSDNGMYSCRAVNDVGAIDSSENFALKISDATAPHIVTIPRDVVSPVKGDAYFNCWYENAKIVEWLFETNTHPLSNTSRFILYPNGSLVISPVENDDQGLYKCRATSSNSDDVIYQTYAAKLQIAYLENLTLESLDPYAPNNQPVSVSVHGHYERTCLPSKGLPKTRSWWEDPKGNVINNSGRIYVDDMRLIFKEVQVSDAGSYSCVAENIAGQTKIDFSLTVLVPPEILTHPINTVVNEGENAIFQCSYKNRVDAVTWLKDDVYVKETGNHILIDQNNGSLLIRNVGVSDVGSYKCEILSDTFSPLQSKSATLNVKEKLKFIPSPVNRKLELNSSAKIYCKAGGSTPPLVKWAKIEPDTIEWPPHIRDDNGTLHFNRVLSNDTGKYMCVATNSQGMINATIEVDVIVMPKFSVHPTDTFANEGEPVMLHCIAEGDPLPTIQWDKNNELDGFSQVRFKVLENGSLFASEIHFDDGGKYGCTAGNSGGFRREEISLVVKAKEYNSTRIGRGSLGAEGENTMTKTIAITLGAAGVYIVLVVGLMMWCRYRRARRKAHMLAQATTDPENSEAVHDMELRDRTPLKNRKTPTEDTSSDIQSSSISKLEFPRENLATVMLLGHGEYGEVFLAKANGILEKNVETVVMVKALQLENKCVLSEFKKEMFMYLKMKHENLSTLLGVCQEGEPIYMITDYTDWGDLKQFLLATRSEESSKQPKQSPLSLPQNLMICQQVAVGMEYMSKQQFIHHDLAARNCLISSNFQIKISCPCLCVDTYSHEYFMYKFKMVPLRWAPAEAVLGDMWSTKSDIWSFAVLVCEVFYKAELPFPKMTNEEVLKNLLAGELKLNIPEECPESLLKLLEKCWLPNPKDRPSFTDIVTTFAELSVAIQV